MRTTTAPVVIGAFGLVTKRDGKVYNQNLWLHQIRGASKDRPPLNCSHTKEDRVH